MEMCQAQISCAQMMAHGDGKALAGQSRAGRRQPALPLAGIEQLPAAHSSATPATTAPHRLLTGVHIRSSSQPGVRCSRHSSTCPGLVLSHPNTPHPGITHLTSTCPMCQWPLSPSPSFCPHLCTGGVSPPPPHAVVEEEIQLMGAQHLHSPPRPQCDTLLLICPSISVGY